jgi:integrase
MKRVAERPRIERRRRVGRAHSCSPPSGAATSTCATSATASGSPAQVAAGVELLRRIYDLRHTFATFALRAGISTFDLSRYMGASLTMMTDRQYGHLARDGREHAIRLLDELSAGQRPRWTLVDAAWTSKLAVTVSGDNESIS